MLKHLLKDNYFQVGAALMLVVTLAITIYYAHQPITNTVPTTISNLALPPIPLHPLYEFPQGGRSLFPDYRLVALYGLPNKPALGALGQQNLKATIARVKKLAATYQPYSKAHILPTLEIIVTLAASSPTANHDYSIETDAAALRPWVLAAQAAGVYVVIDLQPGRTDFLTQAKQYQELLTQPNVGLGLDPEWRLKPNQVHLKQIGSVTASEINDTAAWLAALVSQYELPQKLFLIQQFRLSMIIDRDQLDTTKPELAYVIQMDGHGKQSTKLSTWRVLTKDAPVNIQFGWKNFYREDSPVLSPRQVMKLSPIPWFVSYQ